jgi:hypothetical protein
METSIERVLSDLQRRWTWNADLMDCRECGRSIHVSRIDETPAHRAGCSFNDGLNPWEVIATGIARATAPTPEREDEDA